MPRPIRFALLAALLGTMCGCINIPYLSKPHPFDPGSEEMQVTRAQQFDPYPDTNIGPAVVGGRPESYSAPMPEPVRGTAANRWNAAPFGS